MKLGNVPSSLRGNLAKNSIAMRDKKLNYFIFLVSLTFGVGIVLIDFKLLTEI